MALCSTGQCNCAIESSSLSISGNGSALSPYIFEVATSVGDRLTDLEARGDRQTYNPSISGAGWSFGSGSLVEGEYWVDGPNSGDLVHFHIDITFGTGATFGAVEPRITSPPIAEGPSASATRSLPLILIDIIDASAGQSVAGRAQFTPAGQLRLVLHAVTVIGGGNWVSYSGISSTIPWIWTIGDQIHIAGFYPRA